MTPEKILLDFISGPESGGDYEVVYGGIHKKDRPKKLTGMTIAAVQAWQDAMVAKGAQSVAAGRYQIIRKTMDACVKGLALDPASLFDTATQDAMGAYLLRKRGFDKWLAGGMSDDLFALELAREWASLPVPFAVNGKKPGQSYYAGDGLNAAHRTIADVRVALDAARGANAAKDKPAEKQPDNWVRRLFSWL